MIRNKRICLNCGSNKTYIARTKNGTPYPNWYKYENGYICLRCRSRLIGNPKLNPIHNPKFNARSINFKGRIINVGFDVRTSVCSLCRKQGKTHIHHMKYHNEDPLRDTIELCARCHAKEHVKLRNLI